MSSTAIIFAKELTRWEDFPGDVPPESKSVWNALSHATQEELKADLAKQGFFSGTSFSFIGIYYSCVAEAVVIGFPKYLSTPSVPQILEHVNLICKVAAKIFSQSSVRFENQFHPFNPRRTAHISNPYDLAVFLLRLKPNLWISSKAPGSIMAQVPPLSAAGYPSWSWKVISRLENFTSCSMMQSRTSSNPS